MKRFIFVFLVSFLGVVSCTDTILNKQPLDTISDAVVWDDPQLLDAYLTEAWANTYVLVYEVNGNAIRNGKGWFQILFPNQMGLETTHNWGLHPNKWKAGGLDIAGGLFEWWEQPYNIIRRLNEFIERVPNSSVDEEFKSSRIAEARFLRAYNYFAMVKRYGGVPLITEVQNLDAPQEELFKPRNKEAEVYDFIISEMDAILSDLPQHKAETNYGKPTKYSALALKSRAALYAGSIAQFGTVQLDGVVGIEQSNADSYYEQAYNAAETIMDSGEFALYDEHADKVMNFRNLFLDKNNSEVIFAVIHNNVNSQQGGNGWAWDWMLTPPPNGVGAGNAGGVYLEVVEEFEYKDGSSGELDRSSITQGLWTTEELWGDKDPRFLASVYTENTSWKGRSLNVHNGIRLPDGSIQTTGSYQGILAKGQGQRQGGSGFGILKMLDESHDNTLGWGTSETDRIVFRYGEVLLNYAEAAFELGRTGDALNAVNKIRERAGIAELSSISREKIRHERQVELAFEGHRYWDERRWRTAVDELSGSRSGLRYILDYETGKYKLEIIEDIDGTTTEPLFREENYYLPITLDRTETNPELVENPGYE